MPPKRVDNTKKSVAIGGDDTVNDGPTDEVTQLRARLDQFEDRHERIKSEFHSLKTINDEMSSRHELEVKELKVDLRLAKRDVDKYKETTKWLREEKRELKDQMTTMNATLEELKRSLDEKDSQIKDLLKTNDKSIRQLSDELRALHEDTDAKQLRYQESREDYEQRVRDLRDETKSLRDQLNKEIVWKRKYDDSVKKGELNTNQLMETQYQIQSLENELKAKNTVIDTKDKELRKISSNYKILREQCQQMDKQTEQFKNKYVGLGVVKEKLIADKDSTLTEVQKLSKELLTVRSHLDLVLRERDAFKLEIDSQREEYEEILDNERKKLTAAETQLANDRKMYRELEDKISTQEQSLYSNDEVIVALDSKISHLEEQLIAIKEEAAKHITTIGNLKDQNSKLTHGFQQSVEKVDELEERIESLHTQLDVREDEINREKGAYIQQLAQQKKAIDHLQDTNDSLMKQKKPLFSITPTKKFVPNSPRQPNCPLEMNDLYKSLAEEKSNNRRLVDEIQRLKGDANYFKNEVFQLKNSIKFDDLSVKSNDSNEHVFRKPLFCAENKKHVNQRVENRLHSTPATAAPPPDNWSLGSQRMHHNIPHRFVETTNKLPNNKCVSCAETIHFGRKAVKCSECGATTHAKCSLKLPNNCGLPVQMMQQLFHSSYDVNENQLADAYYQTQRIDDVINVEPLEPSAPEETFVKYDDNSDSSGTTDNNEPDNGAVLTDVLDADYREIQDICDKENDGFSFTDSMLEVLDREYK